MRKDIYSCRISHIQDKHKRYCSWTCYNHRDEGIDDLKPKKKVEIKCTTCQDYAFCDFDKILHHHRSGTPCKDYKERK